MAACMRARVCSRAGEGTGEDGAPTDAMRQVRPCPWRLCRLARVVACYLCSHAAFPSPSTRHHTAPTPIPTPNNKHRTILHAAQELFTRFLLPDRKLRFLEQQPLAALGPASAPLGRDGERRLLLWWTEDCVKRRYAQFVAALEEHSKDNLEFLKEKAMRVMGELLAAKPECEAALLSGLVNKLGDPSRQVASKAVYLLMQLLGSHPVMKPVVVREVSRGPLGGVCGCSVYPISVLSLSGVVPTFRGKARPKTPEAPL